MMFNSLYLDLYYQSKGGNSRARQQQQQQEPISPFDPAPTKENGKRGEERQFRVQNYLSVKFGKKITVWKIREENYYMRKIREEDYYVENSGGKLCRKFGKKIIM